MGDSPFVGSMHVADNMSLEPGHCGICRGTPMKPDGTPEPCIDTGVDVNWGEQLYICKACARVMGAMMGMEDDEVVARVKAALQQSEKKVKELTEESKTLQDRIDRMIDGARARKEAKKGKVKS